MNNVLAVIPKLGDALAKIQFEALMAAMNDKGMGAIVRYCRTENASPKIGVLKYCRKGYGYFIHVYFTN